MASHETAPATVPDHGGSATPVLWFAAWVLTGTAGALGFVSLGPILLGSLVFLYIAYLQRHGPGTACWHTERIRM